jgi:hypothetical protein
MMTSTRLSFVLVLAFAIVTLSGTGNDKGDRAQQNGDDMQKEASMDGNASDAGSTLRLTAIDVLLEPDATMVSEAEAANARLRENFPTGYALNALHAPHITMLQRHVRTCDLDSMYLAVQRVFETEHLADLQMKATGYYYIPFTEKGASMGLAGIVIEPSADLLRLQQKLIDAVAPFSERGGTAVAYITAPENAHLLKQLIEYVDNYVPEHSGKNFNPHVTVGVGHEDFLKGLKAEPFNVFTFNADAVAVCQLGDFGTAAKKLWNWAPQR